MYILFECSGASTNRVAVLWLAVRNWIHTTRSAQTPTSIWRLLLAVFPMKLDLATQSSPDGVQISNLICQWAALSDDLENKTIDCNAINALCSVECLAKELFSFGILQLLGIIWRLVSQMPKESSNLTNIYWKRETKWPYSIIPKYSSVLTSQETIVPFHRHHLSKCLFQRTCFLCNLFSCPRMVLL